MAIPAPTPATEPRSARPGGCFKVVVASGKGGTGKTLVSSQLAHWFAERGVATTYVDADAEAPNGHIVLRPEISRASRVRVRSITIRSDICNGCGSCTEVCAFGALVPGLHRVHQVVEHCRGCGSCLIACPRGALVEGERDVGSVVVGQAGRIRYVAGAVDVGERRAVPVIEASIALAAESCGDGILVIDGPPGNACPVMAALKQADLAILVTEPTPFGAHDLAITADTCAAFGVPSAIVVNRAGLGDYPIDDVLAPRGLTVTATIPFDSDIARESARDPGGWSSPPALDAAIGQLARWVRDRLPAPPQCSSLPDDGPSRGVSA